MAVLCEDGLLAETAHPAGNHDLPLVAAAPLAQVQVAGTAPRAGDAAARHVEADQASRLEHEKPSAEGVAETPPLAAHGNLATYPPFSACRIHQLGGGLRN